MGWKAGLNDLEDFLNSQTMLLLKVQAELLAAKAGKGRQGPSQEAPLDSVPLTKIGE